MKDKNAWNSYDKEELAKLEKLCKAYREFLDAGKTAVSYTHLTLPTTSRV